MSFTLSILILKNNIITFFSCMLYTRWHTYLYYFNFFIMLQCNLPSAGICTVTEYPAWCEFIMIGASIIMRLVIRHQAIMVIEYYVYRTKIVCQLTLLQIRLTRTARHRSRYVLVAARVKTGQVPPSSRLGHQHTCRYR